MLLRLLNNWLQLFHAYVLEWELLCHKNRKQLRHHYRHRSSSLERSPGLCSRLGSKLLSMPRPLALPQRPSLQLRQSQCMSSLNIFHNSAPMATTQVWWTGKLCMHLVANAIWKLYISNVTETDLLENIKHYTEGLSVVVIVVVVIVVARTAE